MKTTILVGVAVLLAFSEALAADVCPVADKGLTNLAAVIAKEGLSGLTDDRLPKLVTIADNTEKTYTGCEGGQKWVKWAADMRAKIAVETKAREDVVVPLCQATSGLAMWKEILRQERSNPSGVVNLQTVHEAGMQIQAFQQNIRDLTPKYASLRHRAFSADSEGACSGDSSQTGN